MAQAKDNATYAIIQNNKVSNIFTKEIMSAWNENDLCVVEIPQDKVNKVSIGTEYKDNEFIIYEANIVQIEDNKSYAILDTDNKVLSIFTKKDMSEYDANKLKVVEIPSNQILEVNIGDTYENGSFKVDLENTRELYKNLANEKYELAITLILGEYTPQTEMISWETQEKEATAYLNTKDISQAPSVALMAQTRGVELIQFCEKILQKSKNYRKASSFLIGYRQKLIDDLEKASDVISIRSITFNMEYVKSVLMSGMQDNTQNTDTQETQTPSNTQETTEKEEVTQDNKQDTQPTQDNTQNTDTQETQTPSNTQETTEPQQQTQPK